MLPPLIEPMKFASNSLVTKTETLSRSDVDVDIARLQRGVRLVPVAELDDLGLQNLLLRQSRRLAKNIAIRAGGDADLELLVGGAGGGNGCEKRESDRAVARRRGRDFM